MWAKLDDRAHSNQKLLEVGLAGAGLYFLGLSYCAGEMSDGFIPKAWAVEKAKPKTLIARLVDVGLWLSVAKDDVIETYEERRTRAARERNPVFVMVPRDGYFVRDFIPMNMSRATHLAKREADAERLRDWRSRQQEPTP